MKLVGLIGEQFIIHHVGSTAIPRMSGKNILDILIGVPNSNDLENVLRKLTEKSYFEGKNREDDYVFLASRTEETHGGDVHIHLAIVDSVRYSDFLYVKKYLLENQDEARKYREAKRFIANGASGNRSAYKKHKSEYVANLLKKARRYYGETAKDLDSC